MQTRRTFLGLLLAAPAAPWLRAEGAPIRVVWIAPRTATTPLLQGARFGAAEARATAALLGRPFELTVIAAADAAAVAREAARARKAGALVVAGGLPARMAAVALDDSAPLLAILPRGDVAAGAERAWRVRPGPEASARALAGAAIRAGERKRARVVAWHPSLRRYGAGELNERFSERTGKPMDEEAWLGWIAVKLALESALRGREVGAARIDGHKGVLLRFDESRTLQQPLYVVVERNGAEVVIGA